MDFIGIDSPFRAAGALLVWGRLRGFSVAVAMGNFLVLAARFDQQGGALGAAFASAGFDAARAERQAVAGDAAEKLGVEPFDFVGAAGVAHHGGPLARRCQRCLETQTPADVRQPRLFIADA